jgi:enoyl-CoA hydratase
MRFVPPQVCASERERIMSQVAVTRQGRIAVVRFDRGLPSNPLSLDLMRELTDVARSFEDDSETSAVILTGRIDTFSLGFDLKDPETRALRDAPLAERRVAFGVGARMCLAWEDIAPLTICAIEGWCVGGGVALAVATDLRIIGSGSRLYVPEIERGLNMSWGSVPRITALTGPARAKRLILLAEKLDAMRAVNWGLADEIAEDGGVMDAAMDWAKRAAAMPPVALRMAKQGINAHSLALARAASHLDADQFGLAFSSEDAREGIDAFLQKRSPRAHGR